MYSKRMSPIRINKKRRSNYIQGIKFERLLLHCCKMNKLLKNTYLCSKQIGALAYFTKTVVLP